MMMHFPLGYTLQMMPTIYRIVIRRQILHFKSTGVYHVMKNHITSNLQKKVTRHISSYLPQILHVDNPKRFSSSINNLFGTKMFNTHSFSDVLPGDSKYMD
ncbi:hypothetical protein RF11_04202 [Thelohanellus kitauei]|uniref:Uncharacterized protein n=1 Tax=Thelohanellus kitauei TaxID=669202 RepID=A0A0C2N680_THEKT|nr:hypothetical protein RF11_04202 [Thelohanellus kitauei]